MLRHSSHVGSQIQKKNFNDAIVGTSGVGVQHCLIVLWRLVDIQEFNTRHATDCLPTKISNE